MIWIYTWNEWMIHVIPLWMRKWKQLASSTRLSVAYTANSQHTETNGAKFHKLEQTVPFCMNARDHVVRIFYDLPDNVSQLKCYGKDRCALKICLSINHYLIAFPNNIQNANNDKQNAFDDISISQALRDLYTNVK